MLVDLKELVSDLHKKVERAGMDDDDLLPTPATTLEQLEELEETIQDRECRSKLVRNDVMHSLIPRLFFKIEITII